MTAFVLRVASFSEACASLSETVIDTASAMTATSNALMATMPTRRLGRQVPGLPTDLIASDATEGGASGQPN